jgi:hypothetical protein
MTKTYVLDLLERVVMTFLGAAVAAVGTDAADWTNLSTLQAAGVAGAAAVLALLKGLAARYIGDKESAGVSK